MSPSNEVSRLSRLEKTLIDLCCRDAPCIVHTAFQAERESTVEDATDCGSDGAFYEVCLEVCCEVHFCPLRFGHDGSDSAADVKRASGI